MGWKTVSVKVLFITGFGRSGTTILDNVLGQVDGFFSVGEIHFVWDRSLRDDRLCGCGEPFSACPVWSEVAARSLGDLDRTALEQLVGLRDSIGPGGVLWRSLRGRHRRATPLFERYVERMNRLLEAVHTATGSQVLVDSSKSPSHGFVLSRIPGIELHVVHLVRDARAVAHAWSKKMIYDAGGDEPMYMTRLATHRSALTWMKWNLVSELLWRRSRVSYLLLRYEDFAARPRESAERILAMLGTSGTGLPFVGPSTVSLAANHSVAGNPSRFVSGRVEIRPDMAWRRASSSPRQLAVVLLTWPLLVRYGYLPPVVVRETHGNLQP